VASWQAEEGRGGAGIGALDVVRFTLLASGFTRNGPGPLGWAAALRYVVGVVRHFGTIRRWLGDRRNPALQEALMVRPSLVRCVARPYLNARWGSARKLEAIRQHYKLLRGPLAFLRFHPWRPIPLALAADRVRIELEKATWLEHEGELTLSLFCEDSRVYSLVFTLGESEGRRIACIGALQGLGQGDALGIYRALTRRMHGLRPRDLLIAAFRSVCVALQVERILAISDDACVGRSKHFGRAPRVLSSYDRAWIENGVCAAHDGFLELALSPGHRSMAEIPSRKRAEHRRRYAMLDELTDQIHRAVEHASATYQAPSIAVGRRSERTRDAWSGDFAVSAFSRF
jgi:uncharacterized protein